jgi:hypothetical protein
VLSDVLLLRLLNIRYFPRQMFSPVEKN